MEMEAVFVILYTERAILKIALEPMRTHHLPCPLCIIKQEAKLKHLRMYIASIFAIKE